MAFDPIALIAEFPVSDPRNHDGSKIDYPTASAIASALEDAGYLIVKREDLTKLLAGMNFVLDAVNAKGNPPPEDSSN